MGGQSVPHHLEGGRAEEFYLLTCLSLPLSLQGRGGCCKWKGENWGEVEGGLGPSWRGQHWTGWLGLDPLVQGEEGGGGSDCWPKDQGVRMD